MATVEAMRLGVLESLPEAALRFGAGTSQMFDLPIYSYLVRPEQNGPLIVFDLGCPPAELATDRGHRAVGVHRGIGESLRRHGVEPSDVDVLVLSHLHWDHCYGIDELPRAQVIVQRSELQYGFAPHPEQWVPYDSFETGQSPDWLGNLDRVRPIDGAIVLTDDVRIVPLPGHTPGSQGLLVERNGTTYVCCGDHIVTYENLVSSPRPNWSGAAVPPGVHVDLVRWRESMSRILEQGWVPLPAHEARVEAVLAGEHDALQWLRPMCPGL